MKSYVLIYDKLTRVSEWKELRTIVKKSLYAVYVLAALALICTIVVLIIYGGDSNEIIQSGEVSFRARIEFLRTSRPPNGALVLSLKFDYEHYDYQAVITNRHDDHFIELGFENPHHLSDLKTVKLTLITDEQDSDLTVVRFTITMITSSEKTLSYCPANGRLRNGVPLDIKTQKCMDE